MESGFNHAVVEGLPSAADLRIYPDFLNSPIVFVDSPGFICAMH
jgi:hypothetical protein